MPPHRPLIDRLSDPVQRSAESECWLWTGRLDGNGYGRISKSLDKHSTYAHRAIYELIFGPVEDGLTLDHLCRNPRCVNPSHLEPVTHRENVLRGISIMANNARKTHCKHGHEFTPENTYTHTKGKGGRKCRQCALDNARRRREAVA